VGLLCLTVLTANSSCDFGYELVMNSLSQMVKKELITEEDIMKFKYWFSLLNEEDWTRVLNDFSEKYEVIYRGNSLFYEVEELKKES
jgi:hypothetical protein